MPTNALKEATEDALERGFITRIEVNFNRDQLLAIKIVLDNGLETFESEVFGKRNKRG